VADGLLPLPLAKRQDGAGKGLVPCSCPSPRQDPPQAHGCPVQKDEHQWELEALQAELEGKCL